MFDYLPKRVDDGYISINAHDDHREYGGTDRSYGHHVVKRTIPIRKEPVVIEVVNRREARV